MTILTHSSINFRTFNSNATVQATLEDGQIGTIELPATLTNIILNFNFTLNGIPVLSGITGVLVITGIYNNGREIAIDTLDISTTNTNVKINGKYTQLNFALSGLTGADTVIIYADQNINII